MLIDGERYQLQLNEANVVYFNAEIRLKSTCIPPVNTVSHYGHLVHSERNTMRRLAFGSFPVLKSLFIVRTVYHKLDDASLVSSSLLYTVQ